MLTAVSPTDRPKLVRNRCVSKFLVAFLYVVTMLFGFFCGCRGFCHRTESDLFPFLLFIECQIKCIVIKILRVVFALPSQPNSALQNYLILRLGYRSVRFLYNKCTVGIHRMYRHSICLEKFNQHWILCFKKTHDHDNDDHGNDCKMNAFKRAFLSLLNMAIMTTVYWLSLLRHSPVIWQLWPCSHALHG